MSKGGTRPARAAWRAIVLPFARCTKASSAVALPTDDRTNRPVDQTCAAAPLPELLKGHVARRRPPRCLAAKQMDPPGPPGAAGHWRLEDNSFLWDPRNMVRMTRRGQASASRCPLDKLAGAAGASSARSRRFPRLRAAAVGLMRRSRGRWRYLVAARRQTRNSNLRCSHRHRISAREPLLPCGAARAEQHVESRRSASKRSARRVAFCARRHFARSPVAQRCFCADTRVLAPCLCPRQVPQCGEVLDPTKLRPYNIRYS